MWVSTKCSTWRKVFYYAIKNVIGSVWILSPCRSNTRKSIRKTKARWLALNPSVMTLRWPTLPWQPNYRATATTRRNMRTRRPSTGELLTWWVDSLQNQNHSLISELKHQVNLVNSLDVWVKVLKVDWRSRTDESFSNTTELVWIWCHFGVEFFIFCTKLIPSPVLIWIWCTSAMPRKLRTWQPRLSTGLSSTSIPLYLQTWTSPGLRGSMDSRVM